MRKTRSTRSLRKLCLRSPKRAASSSQPAALKLKTNLAAPRRILHYNHFMKATAFTTAIVACLLLACTPALAQYIVDVPEGIELIPVESEEEMLSMPSPHPLVVAAQEVSGLALDGLFRPDATRSRFFTMEWNTDGDVEYLAEYELRSLLPQKELEPEPVSYLYEDGEVLIGFGLDVADSWSAYLIISYWLNPDGSIEELQRWECGAEYCYGVYALDLIGDGVVELVVPWATGAGGGGGVEVLAVVPTGGLAYFGDNDITSGFWSSNGSTDLIDFNGDGIWELTAYFPLLFSAAGYYYVDVLIFDYDLFDWRAGPDVAPELYATQHDFYHRFADIVRDFAEDPEAYRTEDETAWGDYACEIDGELYFLSPFMVYGHEQGGIDEMWVEEFLDMVATMDQ